MKHLIILAIFCLINPLLLAQNTQRSSLGMSGNTIEVTVGENTFYVSQSIGQNSVIGTFSNNISTIRQGFQQPPIRVETITNPNNSLNVVVYPNPVNTHLSILLNEPKKTIIVLHDVTGRIVYHKLQDSINIFEIDMSLFSSGVYLLKINSGNKYFTARLIKK
jgi:hypothetical protein